MAKSGKRAHGFPSTIAKKRDEKQKRAQGRRRNQALLAGAIAALVLTGVGFAVGGLNRAERRVRDLSLIGNGVPAVVQVHDTTCPICSELRANVKRIEREFDDDELLIRIADIHDDDGLAFAARHTAERRVTLLFLDGEGGLVDTQTGVQEPDALRRVFALHAAGDL